MLFQNNLSQKILIDPIKNGANSLKIISGYASPTMASWHIKEIESQINKPIDITLIIGMCEKEGIPLSAHHSFRDLTQATNSKQSKLTCQYIYTGIPVHSKLYLWEKNSEPTEAYIGSANYTQTAFSELQSEILCNCDPEEAKSYFEQMEANSIYCNHAEVEEYVKLKHNTDINDDEQDSYTLTSEGNEHINLSLLSQNGDIGRTSGLNWGQRPGREPNQAYIPLNSSICHSPFFPKDGKHFSVLTDDKKHIILRREQANGKAITTPLNNSHLGEYFRSRLGLPNGAFIHKQDLENYGRTDVKFYKLDEEQYFMDFSVNKKIG